MLDLLLALVAALFGWLVIRRQGWIVPVVGTFAAIGIGSLVRGLQLLVVEPLNIMAFLILLVGMAAMLVGTYLLKRPPQQERGEPAFSLRVMRARFPASGRPMLVVCLVALGLCVIGFVSYRNSISGFLGDQPFDDLLTDQVRGAEGLGVQSPLSILTTCEPILAVLGIVGMRLYSRYFIAFTIAALYLASTAPNRTAVLVAVLSASMAVLVTTNSRRERKFTFLLLAAAAVFAFIYFTATTEALSKDFTAVGLQTHLLPPVMVNALAHFTGAGSALSVALGSGINPNDLIHVRSLYIIAYIAQALGFDVTLPTGFSDFVQIPIPFNVYTGFGDLYFDLGVMGLVVGSTLFGLAAVFVAGRFRLGSPWAVIASPFLTAQYVQFAVGNSLMLLATWASLFFALLAGVVLAVWPRSTTGKLPAHHSMENSLAQPLKIPGGQ